MANLDEVGHWLTNGGNTRDLYGDRYREIFAELAVLRTTITGPLAELIPDDTVHTYPLHAISQDLYVVREPEAQTWVPVTFHALATGERYLHFGARATPRVS